MNLICHRTSRLRISLFPAYLCFLICLITAYGCDNDEGPSGPVDAEVFGRPNDGGMGGEMMGNEEADTETFLTYTRIFTEMGMPARGDLVVFNMSSQDEVWLNEGVTKEQMDCVSRGCEVHPSLSWVAWL